MQHVDRSELVEKYKKVARRFDSTGLSIEESVVRLDALIEACSQLELGQSLLVMGHMGVGKTSFIKCLAAKFGPERTVFVENVPRGVCKDQVKRDVGLSECASFIAKSERAKSRSFLRWRSQKRDVSSWRERIKESGQSALAFLGDYITS